MPFAVEAASLSGALSPERSFVIEELVLTRCWGAVPRVEVERFLIMLPLLRLARMGALGTMIYGPIILAAARRVRESQ